MKFFVFSVLLVSVVSAFHIETPASLTTCDPVTLEYDTRSGVAPFSCTFHSDSADGPVLAALTNVNGTSYTWDWVSIPAGTNVVVVLSDSSGKGSATPVITVGEGSSDACLANPTSIPPVSSLTVTYPASTLPSSFSTPDSDTYTSTTTVSSLPSGVSSSLSSLSSVFSSANSVLSSLSEASLHSTGSTSTPRPSSTGGLGTSGGVVNAAGIFTIGAISAVVGAFLA